MANPNNPYLEDNPYDDVDEIPKSENLLQKAIKLSSGFTEGFSDAYTLGGTSLARSLADKLVPLSPEAENKFQEMTEINPLAKGIGMSIPIAKGGVDLVKSGVKGIGKLFGEKAARRNLSDVAYTGSKEASDLTASVLDEATTAFGEGLDKLPPVVSGSMLAQAGKLAVDEMGLSKVAGHPLLKEIKRLTSLGNNPMSAREVQMQIKNVTDKMTDIATRSTFYKKVIDVLPDSHKALKSAYSPVFHVLEQGKKLTRGALKRVGHGTTMGDTELSVLKEAEDTLGLNLIEKAMKAGKAIDRTKAAKVAALTGSGLVGAGFLGNTLKKLISDQ